MTYTRRKSHEIKAGNICIGGNNPIRVQSMTNTSTMDTEASVAQILRIAEAGGELVRLTTQGTREAENMALISKAVRESGCSVPLVADVHFNPNDSMFAIEGICSPDGRVFGKMGHSERIGKNLYRNVIGEKDQKIFESGVKYFR